MTVEELQIHLDTMDDGILRSGSHQPGREFCALEFESQVRKRAWSDAPITLPDLRQLNDAPWSSNQARTKALLPVMVALWDWSTWSEPRKQAWATAVVIKTVQQVVSELPSLSDDIRDRCRQSTTLKIAAEAAGAAGAAGAAWAAWAAAEAAAGAAWAAWAAADSILEKACAIWAESAKEAI